MKHWIVFILCGFVHGSWACVHQLTEEHVKVYRYVAELKLTEATDKLSSLPKNNVLSLYLENLATCISLLTRGTIEDYRKNLPQEEAILEKISSFPACSPYYLFVQAEIKWHWALVKYRFGDNFKAIWGFRSAYALLKENQQKYPDFLPTYKTLGFIMAGAGAIPTQYEWILTILGIEKDVEKGMEYLFRISRQKENIWSIETYLLLCYLQAYLLNQSEKAYHTLEQIIVEQPSLSSVRLACVWIGIRAGKSKESYRLLQNFPKMEFYFIPYLEGICLLQTGNYQEAIKAFEAFLHRNPTTDYIKDSYYKMFLASWFLGKENQAMFFLNTVRNKGSTHNTQDQYAFQFAHYDRLPNKKITEARILTDGGELEKALKILEELNPDELLSIEDKVEYFYRKARIRHKMHDYSEAIRLYKHCIAESHSIARYFAPSACLMLGFMYKDVFSDNEKALYYFQKTLTYSNHEYKKSLDNQAKMAILMLKKHN